VNSEKTAGEWILGQIKNNLCMLDVPIFLRMFNAWQEKDIEKVEYWNEMLLALREAAELRQEDGNLGAATLKVLNGLEIAMPQLENEELAFVTVFAFACHYWSIDMLEAAHGLLWSWCENQVAAAIKLVPLGQTSGQRIMSEAIEAIAQSVKKAQQCKDADIGLLAPGLAIASALHETQYTRLFRS
jgi:urease accessory protein